MKNFSRYFVIIVTVVLILSLTIYIIKKSHNYISKDDIILLTDAGTLTKCGNSTTDNNKVKENDLQIHTDTKHIAEIDYSSVTPLEFLDMLKQHLDSIYSVTSVPDGWIKYEHVKELIKYVDSKEPCARVVSALSSYLPQKTSTVGNEAIFLIEGFLRGKYPPTLYSEGFTDRDAQWYKAGWENYWKDKINERNTFIYLRSPNNSEIELNEVKKYLGTPTMIYTVYDQEELETTVSMIEKKTCIWIDSEAVEAVDKDWLYKKAVEEKYPVILIGHSSALYSFRDLLSVCRYIHGPKIPEEVIHKDGFAAYLFLNMNQQENSLTVNAILRGFPGIPDVREIVSISNKLLAGCNGLIEKSDMSPEARLRYDYWTMKSNPENEELIDKVLSSFNGIHWSRLYNLDSDDIFLIMEWFADRSLHGDQKALMVFLENREGLDAAVAEGYYGWLAKILRENTEVFVKSLAALKEDDIDNILFYLDNECDGNQVFEKRLKEAQESSDFNEREKAISERLLDMVTGAGMTIDHNQPIVWADREAVKVVKEKNEDINGDGKAEKIEYTALARPHSGVQEVTLKINDSEITLQANHPSSDFNIVDIDHRDKYKEIDIYEDGPSYDPKSTFFIYNGKEIVKIGELYAYKYSLDGESKILANYDRITLFKPTINVGWTEMNDKHEFSYNKADKSFFINKQYEIAYSQDSSNTPWRIFKTYEANPYGNDYLAEVHKGDKATVVDIVNQGGRDIAFKVRLENGIEGWMIHLLGGD